MSSLVQAQSWQKNRISASGGGAWWVRSYTGQSVPSAGVAYGYRAGKYVEFETGLTVGCQPGATLCDRFGCYDPNDRYFWVPVGVRFIAPLIAGRVELSAGGGGLIQRYSDSNTDNRYGLSDQTGLGGYFTAGGAVALDHRHRFWIGATPRFLLANPEFRRYRWFTVAGDFSFRF